MTITTRPATDADAAPLADLLNAIVRAGGTTAIETELSPEDFATWFMHAPGVISLTVASDGSGIVGFQHLERVEDWPEDYPGHRPEHWPEHRPDNRPDNWPDNWAAIATFTRIGDARRGVGRALMQTTLAAARAAQIAWIDATIRADNAAGLGFYARMGFEDYAIRRAVPLADGTPVDRISKKRAVG